MGHARSVASGESLTVAGMIIGRVRRPSRPGGTLLSYPNAHVFRPPRGIGAALGGAVAVAAVVLGLTLVVRGFLESVSFAAFGSEVLGWLLLALGAVVAYWAYALYELRYIVDDESLVIVWGFTSQVIPVDQIERIVLGRSYGEPRLTGLRWPGCNVGLGHVPRIGPVLFYSAHRTVADLVYVRTPTATFGLSLGDARGLARAIQSAQETSAPSEVATVAIHRALSLQGFLHDRAAVLLTGAAFLAFLVVAGYIYGRYQALPLQLPLPYPPANGPQRVGQRAELVRLPLTALLWLIVGVGVAFWARTRVRAICYTVLAGTLFAECLYAIGAFAAAH